MAPRIFPTGVTLYHPAQGHECYVLFSAPDGATRDIDLNGRVLKHWPYFGIPPEIVDPAINGGKRGNIVLQLSEFGTDPWGGIFSNRTLGELDWQGNVLWEWGRDGRPGLPGRQLLTNWVYRAQRVPYDWVPIAHGASSAMVDISELAVGQILADASLGHR